MRNTLTYKSIANRYGYPIYINGFDIYLSDWPSYNIRDTFIKPNREFKEKHPFAGVKIYPRYYGTISLSLISNSFKITKNHSYGCSSFIWILPDVKYRKKGVPELTNDPQILADQFKLDLTLSSYGSLYIMNKSSKICQGDLTRLISRKIRSFYRYETSSDKESIIYTPKKDCKWKK